MYYDGQSIAEAEWSIDDDMTNVEKAMRMLMAEEHLKDCLEFRTLILVEDDDNEKISS